MGQTDQTSAWVLEGKMPIREVYDHPLDFSNPQMQGPANWELESVDLKAHIHMHQAWRPTLDGGAHVSHNLQLSPGIVTVNPDACLGSASLSEEE
jgi:hypothetical protein